MVYNNSMRLGHLETDVYFYVKKGETSMDFAGVASVVRIVSRLASIGADQIAKISKR